MRASVMAVAMAAGLACAASAAAQDFQPQQAGSLVLNVRVTDVDPSSGDPILTATNTVVAPADISSSVMPTLGLTYFLTDHIAVEAIAGTTQHDIAAGTLPVAETWVLPPVVTLQYHFNPRGRIDPYVGAGVNYMLFYSTDDAPGFADTEVEDGFGWALQAGADIAVRGRWAVNIDVKKIFFNTEARTTLLPSTPLHADIDLDPWVISVGLGYRFR